MSDLTVRLVKTACMECMVDNFENVLRGLEVAGPWPTTITKRTNAIKRIIKEGLSHEALKIVALSKKAHLLEDRFRDILKHHKLI